MDAVGWTLTAQWQCGTPAVRAGPPGYRSSSRLQPQWQLRKQSRHYLRHTPINCQGLWAIAPIPPLAEIESKDRH